MLDWFLLEPSRFLGENSLLAMGGAFLWGLGSALLSPCHLGIIPLLGSHAAGCGPFSEETPSSSGSGSHSMAQVFLFIFGCYLTIPLYGLLIALFGHGLELGGHYWTIPIGLLLLWFGWDMNRSHSCGHVPHLLETLRTRLGLTPASGVFALGIGYGLLAGGCTVGFLVPLLVVTLGQGVAYCTLLAACFGIGHCLPMVAVGCSAPLAKRILYARHAACRLHEHPHEHGPDIREPHSGEALFRRILGIVIILIGILFVLHPFLEH